MKIIAIKTNDGYLISDNIENNSYFNSTLNTLKFEEELQPTFKPNWFKIKNKPVNIYKILPKKAINKRFELNDKSLSPKFKDIYLYDDVYDYEFHDFESFFSEIKGLYDYKEDYEDESYELIDFEFEEIIEIDVFNEPSHFSYKAAGQWDHQKYPDVTDKNIQYDFIGEILTPNILKHNLPCKLSQKDTYDIIRKYIKENINPKVAEITNDYDFCFTVKKKIILAKEHVYQVDVNDSFFKKRKRKPKYETRYQKERLVKVFEMCHAKYQDYTPITPFEGDNQDDLKDNIDNYLNHLINIINEPLKECSHCNGCGVIININNQKMELHYKCTMWCKIILDETYLG